MIANPALENNPQIIKTPKEHALTLHGDGKGKVTISQRKHGKWSENPYPLDVLPDIAEQYSGQYDVYITQNRFYGRRRFVNLCELRALFTDIDYYKQGIELQPEYVLDEALHLLDEAGLPEPSLGIFSGQGIYLIWLHTPIPRQAAPRWNLCQKIINDTLKSIGADPRSKDASRVLRLIGSRHAKSKFKVRPLTITGYEWPFDMLFDEIAPIERKEIEYLRVKRAEKRAENKNFIRPDHWMNSAELWEGRLAVLQYWREYIRWFGELPAGHRDGWMFWAGNAVSWLVSPVNLRQELFELSKQHASWDKKEAYQRLMAIMNRSHAMARGETIEWEEKQYSPLYHAKDETIIDFVGITEEEQRVIYNHFEKPILCNENIKKEYQRVKDRERRGAIDSSIPFSKSEDRKRQVRELKKQGMSVMEIAKLMNLSRMHVYRLLEKV